MIIFKVNVRDQAYGLDWMWVNMDWIGFRKSDRCATLWGLARFAFCELFLVIVVVVVPLFDCVPPGVACWLLSDVVRCVSRRAVWRLASETHARSIRAGSRTASATGTESSWWAPRGSRSWAAWQWHRPLDWSNCSLPPRSSSRTSRRLQLHSLPTHAHVDINQSIYLNEQANSETKVHRAERPSSYPHY